MIKILSPKMTPNMKQFFQDELNNPIRDPSISKDKKRNVCIIKTKSKIFSIEGYLDNILITYGEARCRKHIF